MIEFFHKARIFYILPLLVIPLLASGCAAKLPALFSGQEKITLLHDVSFKQEGNKIEIDYSVSNSNARPHQLLYLLRVYNKQDPSAYDHTYTFIEHSPQQSGHNSLTVPLSTYPGSASDYRYEIQAFLFSDSASSKGGF